MNSRKVEERYADDASFRALVDMLMNFIMACEFSPSELRDAAVLAAIRYETMYSRPVYVRNPDGGIDRIDSYHRKDGRIGL